MTRVEPRLAWTTPFRAPPAAPFVLLSTERSWAWRSALALSVAVHIGLAVLVGDAVLEAADHAPPPQLEVELVVPVAPEAAVAAPDTASPAVAAPTPPPPPAPAPAEQQAPAKTAPAAAEPEPTAKPVPKEPSAAPLPKAAASPPPAHEKAAPAQPEHAKPEPLQRPEPLRPQIAAHPPAPESGHGIEGRQSARATDMGADATVRAILTPAPQYPPIAVQLLEEGTVIVRINIDDNGVAKAASVLTSSGYGSLDQVAVAAARHWRFAVPKQGSHAIAHIVDVPFVFKLKHASR